MHFSAQGTAPSALKNNEALKCFREWYPAVAESGLALNPDGVEVGTVIHDQKGLGYKIDNTKKWRWSWLDMIAQLDDASLREVVGGGIITCEFAARPNSYDHKVQYNERELGLVNRNRRQELKAAYDFVLTREDGTGVRLHPAYKGLKIEAYHMDGHASQVEPPSRGPGTSDGRGTFRRYSQLGVATSFRFRDPQ